MLLALSLVGSAACAGDARTGPAGDGGGSGRGSGGEGITAIARGDVAAGLDALPKGDLTTEEIAGLVRMSEEELLARDVYVAMEERWGTRIFSNISAAEQTHADAVAALLERYAITDPAANHEPGSFVDPELQAVYTALVEAGSGSLVDALEAGATVEELDLADLAALATDTPDIAWVYDHLARGSRNHLRAFVRQLARNGASYTPTHIDQDEFDSIIEGAMEPGSGRSGT